MEKKYILDNDGYYLGIVDNELATHTKITELLPEFTDTQRCKWDGNQWLVEDSQTLIDAKIKYDAQEYARNRATAYDSVGDQLDQLMKDMRDGTTTHQTACEAVKTKWPKDNSGPVE